MAIVVKDLYLIKNVKDLYLIKKKVKDLSIYLPDKVSHMSYCKSYRSTKTIIAKLELIFFFQNDINQRVIWQNYFRS